MYGHHRCRGCRCSSGLRRQIKLPLVGRLHGQTLHVRFALRSFLGLPLREHLLLLLTPDSLLQCVAHSRGSLRLRRSRSELERTLRSSFLWCEPGYCGNLGSERLRRHIPRSDTTTGQRQLTLRHRPGRHDSALHARSHRGCSRLEQRHLPGLGRDDTRYRRGRKRRNRRTCHLSRSDGEQLPLRSTRCVGGQRRSDRLTCGCWVCSRTTLQQVGRSARIDNADASADGTTDSETCGKRVDQPVDVLGRAQLLISQSQNQCFLPQLRGAFGQTTNAAADSTAPEDLTRFCPGSRQSA